MNAWGRRVRSEGRSGQRGQALIYGLGVVLLGVGVLYFVVRAGALVEQKMGLVDTADSVAYAAATMDARLLNFDAYTNRAMLADSVTIAQLVSVSSWLSFASRLTGAQSEIVAEADNALKYPSLQLSLRASALVSNRFDPLVGRLRQAADLEVHDVLMRAQRQALAGLPLAREQAMQSVIAAAGYAPGSVQVQILSSQKRPDVQRFIDRYTGERRQRFADVVLKAVRADSFNTSRSWILPGMFADCPTADLLLRPDFQSRRGGTELLNLQEWRAVDTLSEHVWIPLGPEDVLCELPMELPGATGVQKMLKGSSGVDFVLKHYDSAMLFNPLGATEAQLLGSGAGGSSSAKFRGIPSVYGLSQEELDQADPRLRVAVRVSATPTTSSWSSLWFDRYKANAAAGKMAAVSAAEVYFSHPRGDPKDVAKPNLYEPYWTAHLVALPDAVRQAQDLQGAHLP